MRQAASTPQFIQCCRLMQHPPVFLWGAREHAALQVTSQAGGGMVGVGASQPNDDDCPSRLVVFCAESAAGLKQVRAFFPRVLWSTRPRLPSVKQHVCLGGRGVLHADCSRLLGTRGGGEKQEEVSNVLRALTFNVICRLRRKIWRHFASREVEAGAVGIRLLGCFFFSGLPASELHVPEFWGRPT